MNPSESAVALQAFIAERGGSAASLSLGEVVAHMLSFYTSMKAEKCNEPNADMLLYQWGTYDWGQGEAFEAGITRQFIEQQDEEPILSQLQLTLRYPATEALRAHGSGSLWCEAHRDVAVFETLILQHAVYRALAEASAAEVNLAFSLV